MKEIWVLFGVAFIWWVFIKVTVPPSGSEWADKLLIICFIFSVAMSLANVLIEFG